MSFQIVRNKDGWILNESEQVVLRDVENQTDVWIDMNVIHFNERNVPYFTIEDNGTQVVTPLTFLNIDNDETETGTIQGSEENDENLSPTLQSIHQRFARKKWENLCRTYKNCKDLKSKTGRGPTRFKFFEKLDEILGGAPTNCSPHSLDVCRSQANKDSEKQSTQEDSESGINTAHLQAP
ncbi:hypothetical protein NQ315_013466 [Exocentrus adspersus]|uniref:Uncharacterized protein n=1 Tax=Exocentrus adspersus TaxID=1586481 RepID=A0AAV8VDN9_9CUCU|nr:hypothetical protein NQ315_013466 [Exocentrus adspersus]